MIRLAPYIRSGRPAPFGQICATVARRIQPEPRASGLERLPESPRFVLAANHYQRAGLWIAHPACFLTNLIGRRYGFADAPVRWVVTANWPRLRLGPWIVPSPGDWLLPRVARALSCYAVPFSGSRPARAASSVRRLVRDARALDRPIGLFPEGVTGRAGRLAPPLPGVSRLLTLLAGCGYGVQPVRIGEDGRLWFEFGEPLDAGEVRRAPDPAKLVMDRIADLPGGCSVPELVDGPIDVIL